MSANKRHAGAAIVERLEVDVHWPSLITSLAGLREPVLLESSLHTTPHSRYSILAADPVISLELQAGAQPFDWMRHRLSPWVGSVRSDPNLPFLGGWIGFTTYEAGLAAEPRLFHFRREECLPLARFSLYDTAAIYDHQEACWYAAAVECGNGPNRPAAERLRSIRALLQSTSRSQAALKGRSFSPRSSPAEPTLMRREFLGRVEGIKDYIRAGDVYQVNLTLGFDVRTDAQPEGLYGRLRKISPSSHAAFMRWGDSAIISCSPELFLNLREGVATTRPIKGTRPRTGDSAQDSHLRAELERSAKDRAELAMIIDLLRNDLGRVCEFASVRVMEEGAIETHPTLFHRVGTITGTLRGDADWCDLLAATFPCGSVTGAPKIRAMQIIEELEPAPRGVYCGAIGYIGLDGGMQFNVAIRTMVQQGNRIHLSAGSGIVADSIAEQEYEETMAKARAMLLALNTGIEHDPATRPASQAAIA